MERRSVRDRGNLGEIMKCNKCFLNSIMRKFFRMNGGVELGRRLGVKREGSEDSVEGRIERSKVPLFSLLHLNINGSMNFKRSTYLFGLYYFSP